MKIELFGIRFETSFLTIALMSIVLILDVSGKVLFCFLCAVIHECGHLLAMMIFSVRPKSITLRPFDIVIGSDVKKSFYEDLLITLSGPLMNFLFSGLLYWFSYPMFVISMFVGIFNMLPLESFDGGHALYLILSEKFSQREVLIIIRVVTFLLLLPMFAMGILVLFYSKYNYSLLLISLYLLAILFIK